MHAPILRDKETEVFAAFLERWPTLEAVQAAKDKTLLDFFQAHHVRYTATIAQRIAAIRAEKPLTSDQAVIAPAKLFVQALLHQLRTVSEAIRRFDTEIDRLCIKLPDYELFRALPDAGPVFSARLLAAFGEQRDREFYERAREKGAARHSTLRALAFKWIRVLFRCWQDRLPYDESRYLSALKKRQSPLLKFAAGALREPGCKAADQPARHRIAVHWRTCVNFHCQSSSGRELGVPFRLFILQHK